MIKAILQNVCFFILGLVLMYFLLPMLKEPQVRIVEKTKIEYKTKWKVPPEKMNSIQAIQCATSELYLENWMVDNWMIIRAYDDCKEKEKHVKLGVELDKNWQAEIVVGAICLTAGAAGAFYLMK